MTRKKMGARPRPTVGPDVGGWVHSNIRHMTLVFDSAEQEAAYREWLGGPESYDAFGRWFDEHHEE